MTTTIGRRLRRLASASLASTITESFNWAASLLVRSVLRSPASVHPRITTYTRYSPTNSTPCNRFTVLLRLDTKARITSVLDAITMRRSVLLTTSNGNSTMLDVRPKTHSRLNMFEPTTLPTAISVLPRYAATPDATSSGLDVPNAMMVRPISASSMLQAEPNRSHRQRPIAHQGTNRLPPKE